jgi:hypothetical protein
VYIRRLVLAILPFLLFVIPTGTAQAKTVSAPVPTASMATSLTAYKAQAFRDTTHAHKLRYQVVAKDSLSAIAQKLWHNSAFWPSLWTANKALIGNDYNLIHTGWTLTVPAVPNSHMPLITVAYSTPAHSAEPAQPTEASAPAGNTYESPSTFSGFQQCVITAESGGQAQVMNSSSHYGLYQFAYSTWVGHGGNGADFGHASVAEQNQVFANTVAADGHSDWSPYDGC